MKTALLEHSCHGRHRRPGDPQHVNVLYCFSAIAKAHFVNAPIDTSLRNHAGSRISKRPDSLAERRRLHAQRNRQHGAAAV